MKKQGNIYTIIYIIVLVVVVGAALAITSMALKDKQEFNANADKMKQILASVHVVPADDDAIKSDFATLNEGQHAGHVQRAFQATYNRTWSYAMREAVQNQEDHCPLTKRIELEKAYAAKCPKESLIVTFLENHDIATDDWTKRLDSTLPVEAVNAAFAGLFLARTVPVIWNGNEIADGSKTSFFGPVEHPARIAETVNWEMAVQPKAQKRMAALRELSRLRREDPAIGHGTMEFLDNDCSDRVLTFAREVPGTRRLVAINLSATPATVTFAGLTLTLAPYEWKVQ